ncbi:uncharacterized protein Bfra_002658 [Botrytis fragariae]|uniref:Azaphilone pigments biosynthesis cluster protein L N-terminal domain-containing protein n=1 Tax=Botrytis fragariae TaxID=1964551 RepID=A0A8H6ELF4_9HELO|nr:uncharacterized protein Bfra_002658 [Botrytis fragariae]KAF5876255.1 hypothetical protein Bfra_002658 [Botrytis fragariae]
MADPLSITASIVGIVVPALHGTRLLLEDLQQLKDAPKTVNRLVDNVHSVDAALKSLQSIDEREWSLLGKGIAEQSETTINSCTQACDLFRADLQRWTKHSEGGKLSWQDQVKVGFFKQGQIKAMSEQLSNCRLAINSIVSIATLYSSVRHSHITEEIKKMISAKQIEVKDVISTADRQLVVLENRLEELNLSSDDDDDDDDETVEFREGKIEAVRQFEEELSGMKASQKLLYQLLSKSQEEAVAKAAGYQNGLTTVTFGSHSSGFQAGIINGGVSGTTFGRY